MRTTGRPRWQHITALVSLSAGGAITGLSFAPGTPSELASPTGMPIHLLALKQSAQPALGDDAMLRSAIVNVASYYLRMANGETPAEMQSVIWQNDSINGADHGESCAAFASMTLELAAQVVGRQSWVTGGTTYPWPLHKWADVRVDENPASPGVTSIRQDAEAHHRWHPLGDGYQPMPGDWVLFAGHVEVVTEYGGGVLHTIGADSLPDFSVNAHEYPDPLSAQGVVGFVNNGALPAAASRAPGSRADLSARRGSHQFRTGEPGRQAHPGHVGHRDQRGHGAGVQAAQELAAIPGASAAGRLNQRHRARRAARPSRRHGCARPGRAGMRSRPRASGITPTSNRRARPPRAASQTRPARGQTRPARGQTRPGRPPVGPGRP